MRELFVLTIGNVGSKLNITLKSYKIICIYLYVYILAFKVMTKNAQKSKLAIKRVNQVHAEIRACGMYPFIELCDRMTEWNGFFFLLPGH